MQSSGHGTLKLQPTVSMVHHAKWANWAPWGCGTIKLCDLDNEGDEESDLPFQKARMN